MDSVQVDLMDKELWHKFSCVTNEMIVTKSGRRMFPVVKIKVDGLNPRAFYQMELEFVQIGSSRWKYMNGGWVSGGKAEAPPSQSIYKHPDSPNLGDFWMKIDGIGFSKVKLTNKPNPADGQVVLNSLHKYQPVVHIIMLGQNTEPCQVFRFHFPEAEFIAVTAYQNEEVTQLKIRHNPFAKAFQDTRDRPLDMFSAGHAYNGQLSHLTGLGGSAAAAANSSTGQTSLLAANNSYAGLCSLSPQTSYIHAGSAGNGGVYTSGSVTCASSVATSVNCYYGNSTGYGDLLSSAYPTGAITVAAPMCSASAAVPNSSPTSAEPVQPPADSAVSSNSPTDLSSASASLSSSSSSSSSLSSTSSYCERYTPLRSHRTMPYSNIRSSAVSNTYGYHEHSYYSPWTQQTPETLNWTLTPEGYYSPV